jgi:hypothetical protein
LSFCIVLCQTEKSNFSFLASLSVPFCTNKITDNNKLTFLLLMNKQNRYLSLRRTHPFAAPPPTVLSSSLRFHFDIPLVLFHIFVLFNRQTPLNLLLLFTKINREGKCCIGSYLQKHATSVYNNNIHSNVLRLTRDKVLKNMGHHCGSWAINHVAEDESLLGYTIYHMPI